jgi:hypothetical protein
VIGGGIWSLPSQDTDYVHYTTDGYEEFDASKPGHVWYENLSDRGQTIVNRTVERGRFVVDDESGTAPELPYPSDTRNLTYLNRSGSVYAIGTCTDAPGLPATIRTMYITGPLVLVGLALCVSGVLLRLRNTGGN